MKCLKSSKVASSTRKLQKRFNFVGGKAQTVLKDLYEGQYYVIKEVDTEKMSQNQSMEALNEIDILGELSGSCPYLVSYYDSFIIDKYINIIMEFC